MKRDLIGIFGIVADFDGKPIANADTEVKGKGFKRIIRQNQIGMVGGR